MGTILTEVNHHPYLGVELSDDLSWSKHIAKITGKANRSLNFISRNLYDCPQNIKDTAYKSLVRPNLEYASPVWDPHLKKEIASLEKIQRKAARFVTGEYSWEESVTNMLSTLDWPTLNQRRFVARQTTLWKAINKKTAIPVPPYIKPSRTQSRGYSHTLLNVSTRTDSYKYSFFPRTVRCWNLLPPPIVSADTAEKLTDNLWKAINAGHIQITEPKDNVYRPRLGSWTSNQQPTIVY